MLKSFQGLAILIVVGLSLAGCATSGPTDRASVVAQAEEAGLVPGAVEAAPFRLQVWQRTPPAGADLLAVFLEGDGFAFIDRRTPSSDPTPRDPVGLALATRSGLPSVAYLARPCQWTGTEEERPCSARWWTTHRLAPTVVEATAHAIDVLKDRAGADRVVLIGHSGGGGLATLVAARRDDVAALVTVAGVTDLGAWTVLHDVSPMPDSLDPAALRHAWAQVPQLHLLGAEDRIVPPEIARGWAAPVEVVPDTGHSAGWAAQWPALEPDILDDLGIASSSISAGRS